MFLQWEGQEEGCRLFGGTHISLGVLQSDTIVQSLLFSRVGYHIGELGLIRFEMNEPRYILASFCLCLQLL